MTKLKSAQIGWNAVLVKQWLRAYVAPAFSGSPKDEGRICHFRIPRHEAVARPCHCRLTSNPPPLIPVPVLQRPAEPGLFRNTHNTRIPMEDATLLPNGQLTLCSTPSTSPPHASLQRSCRFIKCCTMLLFSMVQGHNENSRQSCTPQPPSAQLCPFVTFPSLV